MNNAIYNSLDGQLISFRKGKPEDSGQIAELICQANSNAIFDFISLVDSGLSFIEIIEKMLISRLGHANPINAILAELDNEIIGMIFILSPERHDYSSYDLPEQWKSAYSSFFNPVFANADSYSIHSFAVRPKYQKNGIGKNLLLQSQKQVKDMGYSKITVGTSESNAASHKAYESVGFRVVGSELLVGMDILECVI